MRDCARSCAKLFASIGRVSVFLYYVAGHGSDSSSCKPSIIRPNWQPRIIKPRILLSDFASSLFFQGRTRREILVSRIIPLHRVSIFFVGEREPRDLEDRWVNGNGTIGL